MKANAIDTHWIRRDGQRLTQAPLQTVGGQMQVPTAPGLGAQLDFAEVNKAHQLPLQHDLDARNNATAMQHLMPDWPFDPSGRA